MGDKKNALPANESVSKKLRPIDRSSIHQTNEKRETIQ